MSQEKDNYLVETPDLEILEGELEEFEDSIDAEEKEKRIEKNIIRRGNTANNRKACEQTQE